MFFCCHDVLHHIINAQTSRVRIEPLKRRSEPRRVLQIIRRVFSENDKSRTGGARRRKRQFANDCQLLSGGKPPNDMEQQE